MLLLILRVDSRATLAAVAKAEQHWVSRVSTEEVGFEVSRSVRPNRLTETKTLPSRSPHLSKRCCFRALPILDRRNDGVLS